MAGRLGGKRVTQVGLHVHEVDAENNLLLVKGAVPGPEERHRRDQGGEGAYPPPPQRLRPSRPRSSTLPARRRSRSPSTASVFGADVKPQLVHETVRAELNAQRAGTRGAKSRGLVSGGRAKPWRQKGTGRARAGTTRAPHWTGGGVAFPPQMRSFDGQGQPQGIARRSSRRAGCSRRRRVRSLSSTVLPAKTPSTKTAVGLLESWGKQRPLVLVVADDEDILAQSFRNLDRVVVMTPARARGRRRGLGAFAARLAGCDRGRRGACRQPPNQERQSEGGRGVSLTARQVLIAPVVSEKSYSLIETRKYAFRVHPDAHKTQIRQAVEELFDVQVTAVNVSKVQPKPKRRGMTKGRSRAGRRRSSRSPRARRSRSSREHRSDGTEEVQAHDRLAVASCRSRPSRRSRRPSRRSR